MRLPDGRRLATFRVLHGADVAAGAERLAGAGDENRAHAGVRDELRHVRLHAGLDRRRERIHRPGVVEAQDGDGAMALDLHGFGHGGPSIVLNFPTRRIQALQLYTDVGGREDAGGRCGEIAQDLGVVDGRAPPRDLDVTPAFERREQHEGVGRAVTLVLEVVARGGCPASSAPVCGSRRRTAWRFHQADERAPDHARLALARG